MATWTPVLGACAARMAPEERSLAERLKQELEDDYLLGWRVPIGAKQRRPDFVVLQPRRRALIPSSSVSRPCTRKSAAARAPLLCNRQLTVHWQALPLQSDGFYEGLVGNVIRAIYGTQVLGSQYRAAMINEGHDFTPEWLKLIAQMVAPATNSLLVLYDDAQSICKRARSKKFSVKRVGIQVRGRTTISKINHRNTRQILRINSLIAADLLTIDEDRIPRLKSVSRVHEGQAPTAVKLSLCDKAFAIKDI